MAASPLNRSCHRSSTCGVLLPLPVNREGVAPLVEEDLRRGRLTKPFGQSLANAYAFWIIRRDGVNSNPTIDAFCQWLRKEASED